MVVAGLFLTALTAPPTATAASVTPHISSIPGTILVGGSFTIIGSGFTPGSVVNFFVATSIGPFNGGPLTPNKPHTSSMMTVMVPKTISLGQGFVSVVVVNTDTGFTNSNAAGALLQGLAADGIPTIQSINTVGLAKSSSDPSFATNNVETVVVQGTTVTLGGTGFDAANGVAVIIFCGPDCGGGPVFVNPGPTLTANQVSFMLRATLPTGPGSFLVANAGSDKTFRHFSNAVSAPIGERISVLSVSQSGSTITVTGTGFFTPVPPLIHALTVINLFNQQAGGVVNLGGLKPDGSPLIPLNFIDDTKFSFTEPAGAIPGAAYVQALNPPFVPFSSSGNDPGGAFTLK
jgi:hypothetical protein